MNEKFKSCLLVFRHYFFIYCWPNWMKVSHFVKKEKNQVVEIILIFTYGGSLRLQIFLKTKPNLTYPNIKYNLSCENVICNTR